MCRGANRGNDRSRGTSQILGMPRSRRYYREARHLGGQAEVEQGVRSQVQDARVWNNVIPTGLPIETESPAPHFGNTCSVGITAMGPILMIILDLEPPSQLENTVEVEQLDLAIADFLGSVISADKGAEPKLLRETNAQINNTTLMVPRNLAGSLGRPRVVAPPYDDHRHGSELPLDQPQSGFPQDR